MEISKSFIEPEARGNVAVRVDFEMSLKPFPLLPDCDVGTLLRASASSNCTNDSGYESTVHDSSYGEEPHDQLFEPLPFRHRYQQKLENFKDSDTLIHQEATPRNKSIESNQVGYMKVHTSRLSYEE